MFAVLCLWVLGMAIVLVVADTPTGRALGVVFVSGIAVAWWLGMRRLASRAER